MFDFLKLLNFFETSKKMIFRGKSEKMVEMSTKAIFDAKSVPNELFGSYTITYCTTSF